MNVDLHWPVELMHPLISLTGAEDDADNGSLMNWYLMRC